MTILYCRLLLKWWNNFRVKEEDEENGKIKNQWTEDYKLLGWSPRGLCPEYLEMGEFPMFRPEIGLQLWKIWTLT
jgi:hypothetical protein